MSITIGEQQLATRRPQDLDDKLLAATGCNAVEAQRWLQGNPQAGFVAAALFPFLTGDAPSVPELAAQIGTAGVAEVAAQVATLYANVPTTDEPQAPTS